MSESENLANAGVMRDLGVPFESWEMPARFHPCIQFLWLLAFHCRPQRLHSFRLSLIWTDQFSDPGLLRQGLVDGK